MSHYQEVCEYGYVHSQCRCPSRDRVKRYVTCDLALTHGAAPHLASTPAPPPRELNEDQTRMLVIGWLTSAANALTMGGSADALAKQQTALATAFMDAL